MRLLRLSRDALLRVMDEQPATAIAVCQTLSRRVRELLEDRERLEGRAGDERSSGHHSQPWVDRLALQRQHAEDALVHAIERLVAHEPLERLDAERELAQRE